MSNRAVLTGRPVTRHGPMDTVPVLARHKRRAVLGPMGRPVVLARARPAKISRPVRPGSPTPHPYKKKKKTLTPPTSPLRQLLAQLPQFPLSLPPYPRPPRGDECIYTFRLCILHKSASQGLSTVGSKNRNSSGPQIGLSSSQFLKWHKFHGLCQDNY